MGDVDLIPEKRESRTDRKKNVRQGNDVVKGNPMHLRETNLRMRSINEMP